MNFYEKTYLQPHHLHFASLIMNPATVKIGEFKRLSLNNFKFEKIWSVSIKTEPENALKYAEFFTKYGDTFIDIYSCWLSDQRPFDSVIVNCRVSGVSKRTWDGLLTPPFWKYVLNESKFHLQQRDYHIAIILAAIASESFIYRFLEEELSKIGWSNNKIKRYVTDNDAIPSLNNKVEVLIKDVLGKKIDDPVYEAWGTYVRDQRNIIMHPKKNLDKKIYGEKSALKAIISSSEFILALLQSVPTDDHQSRVIEDLEQEIEKLKNCVNTAASRREWATNN